jgi:hypothetical protein
MVKKMIKLTNTEHLLATATAFAWDQKSIVDAVLREIKAMDNGEIAKAIPDQIGALEAMIENTNAYFATEHHERMPEHVRLASEQMIVNLIERYEKEIKKHQEESKDELKEVTRPT